MALAEVNLKVCSSCSELEKVWLGSGVKLAVSIKAQGFDMLRDDFTLTFKCGVNEVNYVKGEMLIDDDGTWYVALDTQKLGAGIVQMTTHAFVPDEDFVGGIRLEIDKINVFEIEP